MRDFSNLKAQWLDGLDLEAFVELGRELSKCLRPGDRLLLEGALGAGKSTLARAVLSGFGIEQLAEGSPTFALVHEYTTHVETLAHLDLYRLESEEELEAAGIEQYLWDHEKIVLVEWFSKFPTLEKKLIRGAGPNQRAFRITILIAADPSQRDINIELFQ